MRRSRPRSDGGSSRARRVRSAPGRRRATGDGLPFGGGRVRGPPRHAHGLAERQPPSPHLAVHGRDQVSVDWMRSWIWRHTAPNRCPRTGRARWRAAGVPGRPAARPARARTDATERTPRSSLTVTTMTSSSTSHAGRYPAPSAVLRASSPLVTPVCAALRRSSVADTPRTSRSTASRNAASSSGGRAQPHPRHRAWRVHRVTCFIHSGREDDRCRASLSATAEGRCEVGAA